MAFRLKLDEPIEKGFRRIGAEQIERSRRELASAANASGAIHEARKCMKRVRALLRLGREGLGEAVFQAENAEFRAVARTLSSARDSHVMMETIVKLIAEAGDGERPALLRFKTTLATRSPGAADDTGENKKAALSALDQALRRFRRLTLEPDSFTTLQKGLVATYRKAIARRESAYTEETAEAFHDWRKAVQAHWRHMALLSKAWPAHFEAQIEAARELSQILGDDHDLAMLRSSLERADPGAVSPQDQRVIEALIDARQGALREMARPLGGMVFSERPKAHGRRVAAIWANACTDREISRQGRPRGDRAAKLAASTAQG